MKLSSIIDNFNPTSVAENVTRQDEQQTRRKVAMAVLAHAEAGEIAARLRDLSVPDHQDLRAPENGLVMLRGRVGGDGAPFNMGEATVSRAAVRLESGEVGFGYTLGRDSEKARLIALCDALVQSHDFASGVEREVIAPLREQLLARRRQAAERTAATKVDFYTMVRGEG